MKVVSMFIDGFGDFFDKQIGPFNSSVVVFFGPNESGKSTILNYIRTILFGFPTRKKKELYPPMEGGHHGGRIVINDGQRNDFVVERYADRQVSIRDMSGTSLPEEKLEKLENLKKLKDLISEKGNTNVKIVVKNNSKNLIFELAKKRKINPEILKSLKNEPYLKRINL